MYLAFLVERNISVILCITDFAMLKGLTIYGSCAPVKFVDYGGRFSNNYARGVC
jgi:hypothetical protein